MLQGLRLDIIERHTYLISEAKKGLDEFPDVLCDYLVVEFDFKSALLFDVKNDVDKFLLFGKSKYVHDKYELGNIYNCEIINDIKASNLISLNTSFNCPLSTSSEPSYEKGAILFTTSKYGRFIIKLSKKTNFVQNDILPLKKIAELIAFYIELWLNSRSGVTSRIDKRNLVVLKKNLESLSKPLNGIIGASSILNSESLSFTNKAYIDKIKSNTLDILQKLSNIKNFISLESGEKAKLELSVFDLKDFVENIFNSWKQSESLHITYNHFNNIPKHVKTDKSKLKFILLALLDFTKTIDNNVKIKVSVSSKANNYISFLFTFLTGSDNSKFNLLENPYLILADETTSESMIFNILLFNKYIQLLEGNLVKDSASSRNINFEVIIKDFTAKSISESLSLFENDKGLKKVLVIESDTATAVILTKYLKRWNYQTEVVTNSKDAIKKLRSENYLSVILDIELKDENGLKLLQKINHLKEAKNTPVIVCSVEPETEEAFMLGAVEYFIKPINYNNLVEILTSYQLRKNSSILCVDDDKPTLNLIKQAIETAGFRAVTESRSDRVMELIKDKELDLAIIDLEMPYPNGYELIRLIKSEEKFAHLPIIIYTGKEDYVEELKQIDGMFTKLLDKKSTKLEQLESTIKNMIEGVDIHSDGNVFKENKEGIKILLAEDYKHSQIIVTRLLKKSNFNNVIVVENGEEAVNYVMNEKVDLILMDMQMPVMNGFEAIEKIRELPEYRETPIISVTAFAMKGDREKCLEAGATDYLPKPIDSKEFIEKVKYYTNTFT
ncbi:signal transduction histidine-protein kinase BarA [bacterium BMS3Abin04]|nr:signal transduction histidine-protein kinase BarA [bacterium BMS3Abin04]